MKKNIFILLTISLGISTLTFGYENYCIFIGTDTTKTAPKGNNTKKVDLTCKQLATQFMSGLKPLSALNLKSAKLIAWSSNPKNTHTCKCTDPQKSMFKVTKDDCSNNCTLLCNAKKGKVALKGCGPSAKSEQDEDVAFSISK